ncbi:MAG: glycoside hydrolase family 125 protein [Clostridia bacterium]|nr:glycoside hydrolase family 125 protein [Clostridia bacterium]
MKQIPASVTAHMEKICARLKNEPKLQRLYRNCYPNTLETTAEILEDGSTFLYTGDIPAMWLRDSTAQVTQYLPLTKDDPEMRSIILGLIRRQFFYIGVDSYANAFNIEANDHHGYPDKSEQGPWVWERKYEIDSLCYPMRLAYLFWKHTGDNEFCDQLYLDTVNIIVNQFIREQHHMTESDYVFIREIDLWQDTIHFGGKGSPVNVTGMTWSGFRPSDDGCTFGYPIASNMFAAVTLRQIEEVLLACRPEETELLARIKTLYTEIEHGIHDYGTYLHPKYGRIYACETDGFGNYVLADDANVPSLLSAPYLGFCSADDPIYQNTRRFILSEDNPYYFVGRAAKGVGSPHTPKNYIWHIALSMQGLTSNDPLKKRSLLDMLVSTDADTGYMHEGFHCDNPAEFTRPWFAWSNSLFAEFVEHMLDQGLINE